MLGDAGAREIVVTLGDVHEAAAPETGDPCVICLSEPATNRVEPCGHVVACSNEECIKGVAEHRKCPLCRTKTANLRNEEGTVLTRFSYLFDRVSPISSTWLAGRGGDDRAGEGRGNCAVFVASAICALLMLVVLPVLLVSCSQIATISYLNSHIADAAVLSSIDQGTVVTHGLQAAAGASGAFLAVLVAGGLLVLLHQWCSGESEGGCGVALIAVACFAGLLTAPMYTLAAISGVPVINIYIMCGIGFGCDLVAKSLKFKPEDHDNNSCIKFSWNLLVSVATSIVVAYLTYTVLFEKRQVIKDPYGVAYHVSLIMGAFMVTPLVPVLPFLFPTVFIAV